jgi:outer membrane lipoprotein LolB
MNAIKYCVVPFAFLLTACAPTPRSAEQPPANKIETLEKRKTETATVSSWEIKGAMAAKNKAKAWSASMNWVQKGTSSYQIRLMGPLGGGTVLINKTGNTITFQDGAKKSSSTNAEELLLQQTGIRLPVSNLYYWVRGLPAPGSVHGEQHDKYNHLTQLQQSGYTVTFNQYTSVKGIDLPCAIRLEGNGVMVKVIIKNWII